jgi:hypothetical protein
MPFFKTTYNIMVDGGEHFDENWMDSDTLVLPPQTNWDYSRELQIEDINIWEQLYHQGGGLGVYAAWDPYAEFYLITLHGLKYGSDKLETYYGPNAGEQVRKRAKSLGINLRVQKVWVESEDMWLYAPQEKKTLILP